MDRWTDQQAYLHVEMQFYISVMFLGLSDDRHEEKPSFLQSKKKRPTDPRTDRPTDRLTNRPIDRPTYRPSEGHTILQRGGEGDSASHSWQRYLSSALCYSFSVIVGHLTRRSLKSLFVDHLSLIHH